ncbi:hypothetical protein GCM10022235_82890 [Kribbella ginsengisoli]|uniref:Uncharacterized protein n=1 Tax=Kribbella ginsengisoli TaxID=363865 RepID=A0ABP6Z7H4_9ACTN
MEIDEHGSDVTGNIRLRACECCAAPFYAHRSDRRFCSDRCRLKKWRSLQTALEQPLESTNPATAITSLLRTYLERCGSASRCEVTVQELGDLLIESAFLARRYASIQRDCLALQGALTLAKTASRRRSCG